ncbi:hypothetical protein BDK51DRAFT_18613, partial [Blyttiomyces helicus]
RFPPSSPAPVFPMSHDPSPNMWTPVPPPAPFSLEDFVPLAPDVDPPRNDAAPPTPPPPLPPPPLNPGAPPPPPSPPID